MTETVVCVCSYLGLQLCRKNDSFAGGFTINPAKPFQNIYSIEYPIAVASALLRKSCV